MMNILFFIIALTLSFRLVRGTVTSCYVYSPSTSDIQPSINQCNSGHADACSIRTFNVLGVVTNAFSCASNSSCQQDSISIALNIMAINCCFTNSCNNLNLLVTDATTQSTMRTEMTTKLGNSAYNNFLKSVHFSLILVSFLFYLILLI